MGHRLEGHEPSCVSSSMCASARFPSSDTRIRNWPRHPPISTSAISMRCQDPGRLRVSGRARRHRDDGVAPAFRDSGHGGHFSTSRCEAGPPTSTTRSSFRSSCRRLLASTRRPPPTRRAEATGARRLRVRRQQGSLLARRRRAARGWLANAIRAPTASSRSGQHPPLGDMKVGLEDPKPRLSVRARPLSTDRSKPIRRAALRSGLVPCRLELAGVRRAPTAARHCGHHSRNQLRTIETNRPASEGGARWREQLKQTARTVALAYRSRARSRRTRPARMLDRLAADQTIRAGDERCSHQRDS